MENYGSWEAGKTNSVKRLIILNEDVSVSELEEAINRTVKTSHFIGKKIEGRDGVYYYVESVDGTFLYYFSKSYSGKR